MPQIVDLGNEIYQIETALKRHELLSEAFEGSDKRKITSEAQITGTVHWEYYPTWFSLVTKCISVFLLMNVQDKLQCYQMNFCICLTFANLSTAVCRRVDEQDGQQRADFLPVLRKRISNATQALTDCIRIKAMGEAW